MRKLIVIAFIIALTSVCALGQDQSAPALRVVTEVPGLPSDLFYGNTRVKPLRLRPGTNQPITINDTDFFVQQQYLDFLNRFPEQQGMNDWMAVINRCNGDAECVVNARVVTSVSFFRSPEFFSTGYFVFRLYRTTYGRRLTYREFVNDARQVEYGVAGDRLEASKLAFAQQWVARPDFQARYGSLSNQDFVTQLFATAGVTPSAAEQQELVNGLNSGSLTRAHVVIRVADNQTVSQREFNSAFVTMQYFGYLRRDPEEQGYQDWLRVLNNNPEAYWTMVWGFIYSPEYATRF